jgi:hypothetical protein
LRYQHKQIGTLAIVAHLIGFAFAVFVVMNVPLASAARNVIWLTFAFFALTAITFSSLTTSVDSQEFCAAFGVWKWPSKRAALSEIAGALPIRMSLLAGWGIRVTTRGWLYSVSGRRAVIIGLTNGKQFLVGSDDAEALAGAINKALPQAPVFTGIRGVR